MPRRMAKQTGNPGGRGDVAGRVGPKSVERVTQLTAVGNRGDSSLSGSAASLASWFCFIGEQEWLFSLHTPIPVCQNPGHQGSPENQNQ